MSNVIEFKKPDFMSYVTLNGNPIGIKTKGFSAVKEGNFAHINTWETSIGTIVSTEEFNQICIAWLALHQPEVLKED